MPGLGICWIGALNEGKVKKILKVSDFILMVSMTPLDTQTNLPQRKSERG